MKTPPGSIVGPDALWQLCGLAEATPPGCFVEVGVYKGGSGYLLAEIAGRQGREIFLYDTFTGIPYQAEDDSHPVGDFGDTNVDQVRADVPTAHVVQGIFPASAVGMPPVAFVHLDCDQYQS